MKKRNTVNLDESITHSLSVGIVAFSLDLTILETNTAAETILIENNRIDRALSLGNPNSSWPNWEQEFDSMLKIGQRCKHESVPYCNNNKHRLLDIICVPLRGKEDGPIIGGTIMLEDVTKRVEMEKRLASSERLAAIGKVAGKVAHELNNPMDGIIRYINLAQRVINDGNPEKATDYLDNCKTGLDRMTKVVKELLEFSRSSDSDEEYIKLSRAIEDAIKTMQPHIEAKNIMIVKNCDHNIGEIKCNSLFQVFCNLIKNATDAMPENGTITISTSQNNSGEITIEFSDTGHGIHEDNLNSIFEPFFTTKDHGRGTGLGLCICKDIIAKHSGTISAQNNPNGGSTFKITLPKPTRKANSHIIERQ